MVPSGDEEGLIAMEKSYGKSLRPGNSLDVGRERLLVRMETSKMTPDPQSKWLEKRKLSNLQQWTQEFTASDEARCGFSSCGETKPEAEHGGPCLWFHNLGSGGRRTGLSFRPAQVT